MTERVSGSATVGSERGTRCAGSPRGPTKPRETRKKRKKRTFKDDLVDLSIRIAIIVAVIWTMFSFVFGIFVNSGTGMAPSVQDRDIVLYYRLDSDYTANEAVVYEADGELRLGRVVARGGDTVEVAERGLEVNGYPQQDYKNVGETLAAKGGPDYPVTLAEDELFVLGDNREQSTDSRMSGPVKLADVKGSAMLVLRRRDI